MAEQNFCLKWDSHQVSLAAACNRLRQCDELTDMTLYCQNGRFHVHRLILSAFSGYFRSMLKQQACEAHVTVVLMEAALADVRLLVEFVYTGCVNVAHTRLPSFLRLARALQISGLCDKDGLLNTPPTDDKSGGESAPTSCATTQDRILSHSPAPTSCSNPPVSVNHCSTPPPPPLPLPVVDQNITHQSVLDGESPGGVDETTPKLDAVELKQHDWPSETTSTIGSAESWTHELLSLSQSVSAGEGGTVYTCRVCCRRYSNRVSLAEHIKSHQGRTVCPVCERVFSMVGNLRSHMRTVHGMSEHAVRQLVPTRARSAPVQLAATAAAARMTLSELGIAPPLH